MLLPFCILPAVFVYLYSWHVGTLINAKIKYLFMMWNKHKKGCKLKKWKSDASSLPYYFAASTSQKPETNQFIEVFSDDGVKYCFGLSCTKALFLVKEVFFAF